MTNGRTRAFYDGRRRAKHADTIYGIVKNLHDLDELIAITARIIGSSSPHFTTTDRLEAQQAKRSAEFKRADLLRDLEAFQEEVGS